ncbi:unnamed protein product [Allacma fusca]|uniref:Uncharacterized protein n=1 Tax=Allacma fusca TaxID=39272 RepID=A0A8J2PJM9_9HEXA|nr:unnamed protein product [Allacma fusca]
MHFVSFLRPGSSCEGFEEMHCSNYTPTASHPLPVDPGAVSVLSILTMVLVLLVMLICIFAWFVPEQSARARQIVVRNIRRCILIISRQFRQANRLSAVPASDQAPAPAPARPARLHPQSPLRTNRPTTIAW